MFKAAIGHTEDPDTEDAIAEVMTTCKKILEDSKPSAAILISSTVYDHQYMLNAINSEFPGIELIGCTSCAEVSSKGYMEGSLILILLSSDTIQFKAAVIRDLSKDNENNAKKTLESAISSLKESPSLCFVLPDVLSFDASALLNELKATLGEKTPIIGGGASDPWKFTQICQFYKTEILHDAAPMLLFSGPVVCSIGVASGWNPFTAFHSLDEVQKDVALKISNRKALQFYHDYIGGSPSLIHPLAVFEKDSEDFTLRAPLGANEEQGSVVFTGALRQNSRVKISHADNESIINAANEAVKKAINRYPNQHYAFGFMASCACRRQILGLKTPEEFEVIKKDLGETPIFGFYSLGQFGPYPATDSFVWHIETVVFSLIGEKNGAL